MQNDTEILKDIKNLFTKQLGGIAESLKPSSMISLIGSEFSSPIVGMMSDKLGSVENFVTSSTKNLFLDEQKEKEDILREERGNDFLEQIVENTKGTEDAINGKDSDFLPEVGDNLIANIITGLFRPLAKGGSKLWPLLTRGLGKIALPLALLFGAKDFIKGFKSVENVSSISGIVDAVQAGISEVVSTVTFGIISPKNIKNVLDHVEDNTKKIIRAPIQLVRGIISGEKPFDELLSESLAEMIDGFTFGFIDTKKIKKAADTMVDSFIGIVTFPINFIQRLFNNKDDIMTIAKEEFTKLLENFSFGAFSKENIEKGFEYIRKKLIFLIQHPIISLQNAINKYAEYLEIPSFDVTGTVDAIVDKVMVFLNDFVEAMADIKTKIEELLSERLDKTLKDILPDWAYDRWFREKDEKRFGETDQDKENQRGPEITKPMPPRPSKTTTDIKTSMSKQSGPDALDRQKRINEQKRLQSETSNNQDKGDTNIAIANSTTQVMPERNTNVNISDDNYALLGA